MLLRDFLLGVLFFSLAIATFTVIAADLQGQYGTVLLDSDYNVTYNKLAEIQTDADEIKTATETSSITSGGAASFFAFGVWNALTLMFDSLGLVAGPNGILYSLGADFGIPIWFLGGLVSALVIVVTFVVISTVFRRRV